MADSVAVIGAGMAGLSAARRLVSRGRRVTVFEKSRGLGGRAATRRVQQASFDHGAQYFTVRSRRFRSLVDPLIESGQVGVWEPRTVTLGPDRTAAAPMSSPKYVGVPGMSSLGRALAAELDVVLSTRIDSLRPQADGSWILRSDEGVDHGPYSGLVLTCPAPQSAALLGSVNPGLAAQCESVSMRPCWAVMAAFDAPVDLDFDAAFVVDDRLAWVARDSSKPGRTRLPDCWTLHATPEWSARNLETDRSVVALKLLDRLFELTGREHREASTLLAHRWRFARPAEESIARPRVEPETRLALAGDWTSGARIEDAVASGIGAANDLIEVLGSRDG